MKKLLLQLAEWKWLLPLLLLNLLFVLYLFPNCDRAITKAAGQKLEILDVRQDYQLKEVKTFMENLKPKGRSIYRQQVAVTDFFFPLVYGLFLILTLALGLKKLVPPQSNWIYLSLLPIGMMLFDFLENFNTLNLIDHYDRLTPEMVDKGAFYTGLKWDFTFLILGLLTLVVLLTLGKGFFFKKR